MKFNLEIERIENGFIFSGEGLEPGKHFYKSLEDFVKTINEELRERDTQIEQHETPDEPFFFKLETDL